jgi:hypothetical protein
MALPLRFGDRIEMSPARRSVFRIASDGQLGFVRSYDIDVGNETIWGMGMVTLFG